MHRIYLRLILLLAVLTVPAHGAIFYVEPAGGGGGPTQAFVDDFTGASFPDDWDEWPSGVGCDETGTADEMFLTDSGLCHYNGTQTSTNEQWAYTVLGTTAGNNYGVALRVDTTEPDADSHYYAFRCDGDDDIIVRVCDGTSGGNCVTFANLTTHNICLGNAGDAMAAAVSGSGSSTEFCIWYWTTPPADPTDPSTWVDPEECVNATGDSFTSEMSNYEDCAGDTLCHAWDNPPDNPEGDAEDDGWEYPDSGNTHVAAYTGTGANREFQEFRGGDL